MLIFLNCVFYFLAKGGENRWSLSPKFFWENMNKEAPKLLTNTFMHANLMHLLFNMFALYFFGQVVEEFLGSTRFVLFYLIACVLTSYLYALVNSTSSVRTLGASGAISSLIGFYFLMSRNKSALINAALFEVTGLVLGQISGINYLVHLIGLGLGVLAFTLK